MSKRIFCILLLLTICLTACGGQKAGATSGKSSTKATTAIATTQENDFSTESEEVPVVEGEFEEPIGITEEFSEEASEEASEVSAPIGTPDHPMAVDPTPYWRGEDYFDLEGYLLACGSTPVYVVCGESHNYHYVTTSIDRRSIHLEGNGDSMFWMKYNGITFAAPDIEHSDRLIWVSEERNLYLYDTVLNALFAAMPAITGGSDCPFAGSGIKHGDIADYWAIHDD